MLIHYLRTAIRNLLQNKGYACVNIAGLCLGLSATLLILLYVKDEVSYDRFHEHGTHLYRLTRRLINPDGSTLATDGYTGYPQGPRFKAGIPEIQAFVRLQTGYREYQQGATVLQQEVHYADPGFFTVFSFPLLEGNAATALQEPHSIVVTSAMALKTFGTTAVLGRTILLREKKQFVPYAITGVARDCPQNSSIKFQVLLPLQVNREAQQSSEAWRNSFLHTFVWLNPGANIQTVEHKMQQLYATVADRTATWTPHYSLQPISDLHLSKEYPAIDGLTDAGNPLFSYILSGVALFILGIACINFVNLTMARSAKRAKEIGIRKATGSNRRQLIAQFFGESLLLCFIAFLLALGLTQLIMPFFNELAGKALSLRYLMDSYLITAYLALFLLTGLAAGFYPAIILSGYNPIQALYNRSRLGRKSYGQPAGVVIQFSLASFLIITTCTLFSQYDYLTSHSLGYNDRDLVMVNQPMTQAEAAGLKQALLNHPAIAGVAPKSMDYRHSGAKVNGGTEIPVVWETVDEAFLPLLNIPLLQGRNFSPAFPSDARQAVIVNETFVKKAGWKKPVGQQVFLFTDPQPYTVIGVAADYHFQPLSVAIQPQAFTMRSDNAYGTLFVKIRPQNTTAALLHLEQTVRKWFPLSAYSFAFKDQLNQRNYEAEAKWKQILLLGAALTILLSCMGLWGLSIQAAEKRRKEIGIRKVLGASECGLAAKLSTGFLKLVIIALCISLPLGWMATAQWLQHYPYRIDLHWTLFAISGVLVIGIALATVSVQAIKAARANPVKSLKVE